MSNPVPENAIDIVSDNLNPHYEPMGWHHWPEHPWLTYQFRRGLGETQEGGGAVSECFLAASRMIPGDYDSWNREWMRVADQNWERGIGGRGQGHVRTAMNCFLRAADYYRQAEFYLEPERSRTGCRHSRKWKPAATNSSATSIPPVKWSIFPMSRENRSAAISSGHPIPATRCRF
jgi:hypothetical protein